MARGGINKALVQKARQSLLARGVNPSIDAVRIELGNTGSKTTILRYLKEIEAYDPRPMSSRDRLGDELCAAVDSLLDRLMEEASVSVAQARTELAESRAQFENQAAELRAELTAAQRQTATQQAAMDSQSAELATTHSSLQAELTRNAGLSQHCSDLEARLADKDAQIRSLEEKHVHGRAALEHYRDAVKEQRDQDQRRHESQLQQVQVELRKLQETLMVKQDETTRLNRDNERLLSDARQQTRLATERADRIERLTGEIQAQQMATAKEQGFKEILQTQLDELRQQVKNLERSLTLSTASVAAARERLTALANENLQLREQLADADAQGGTDG